MNGQRPCSLLSFSPSAFPCPPPVDVGTDDLYTPNTFLLPFRPRPRPRAQWNEIVRHKPNERLMEDAFRKFWSLKEAYTKGRGDGLGFEFRRCDFALNPTLDKGANAQQVQRATVKVDGLAIPQWGFYIQPLEADHWISVARGPPRDMVDANGEFRKTFGTLAPELGPELERAEHAFEKKTVAELIADDMRAQYATLC